MSETEAAPGEVVRSARGISRRELLKAGIGIAAGACLVGELAHLGATASRSAGGAEESWLTPAKYYRKLPKRYIKCQLCPRHCYVAPGARGFCEVRENHRGSYFTLVYGRAATLNIDPIEKKPFFHVLPGSPVFSFATAGCNLECKNCQNWQLSQSRPEKLPANRLPPKRLVEAAREQGCSLIAGTYSEPTVFFEYLLDVARQGNTQGVRTVMVSSGFTERKPMLDLCKELTAIKIDLKSMRQSFYKTNCQGALKPVLNSIERVKKQGVWLEIVYLVIPTLNDSESEIKDLARWIRTNVGLDVPLHFSRFHPEYKLTRLPPTPYRTLDRCAEIARAEGLHYVYVGNVPDSSQQATRCPKCQRVVIGRENFGITARHLKQGRCGFCGQPIPGIWS
jgi:pyruvate formate lyase activating enzyme